MELVKFNGVSKDFGHREVLSDVSFRINAGQKVGFVGPNGAGKTTLLRILNGEEPPSGGSIWRLPGVRLGYVPQAVEHDDGETALQTVLRDVDGPAQHYHGAADALAAASGDGVVAATTAYEAARDAYERAGGDRAYARAEGMLDALGLRGKQHQLVGTLSGGEKNVLSLARALLAEPDLLILDEPGNHLDFQGLSWLEGFLNGFRGAVLIVSHNRYLLDRVVDTIVQLDGGRTKTYAGNYTAYRATLLREKLSQQADYVVNQRRLVQLEELVRRFEQIARARPDPAWGKRLRARRSQLERERAQAVEKPKAEASSLRMSLNAKRSRADIALQVRGYDRGFDDNCLFEGASLEIAAGDRVALVGPNGSGKTTFLRDVIARGAWDDDVIRIGPSLRVGYCAQEQEVLNEERTVFDEIAREALSPERTRTLLAQFLFGADDLTKRVGDLSGGERNRLQLAKLTLQQPDFLILDEPTNHLDIAACEAIEEALASFRGTILVVSHDRYFLDKIAERVVEVRDRAFVSYAGNFSEYWAERQAAAPAREKARVATRRSVRERGRVPAAGNRSPVAEELQARISATEQELASTERRVAEAFGRGAHVEGTRLAKQLEELRSRLDKLYDRWLEVEG
jgi:ATP-binding cassette subfamily F protein 3